MYEQQIFSQNFSKDTVGYQFEIVKSDDAHLFLRISESTKDSTGQEKRLLSIASENVELFAALFQISVSEFRKIKVLQPKSNGHILRS